MSMPHTQRRYTVDEYHRMAEAGILLEDERVELIHGQIVRMSPIGARHASCVNRLNALLTTTLAKRATVSVQNPLVLAKDEEPQPDVVLLRFRADGYRTALPTPADALLVIEVADSSLGYDRREKLPLYAGAQIQETWLVNLDGDRVEIHREPEGDSYSEVHTARRGEKISPLAFPDLGLEVEAILA